MLAYADKGLAWVQPAAGLCLMSDSRKSEDTKIDKIVMSDPTALKIATGTLRSVRFS
jgi:hypothetical protein